MKAPAFWWRPPGLASRLLGPAAALYGAAAASRLNRPGLRATIPVICVGNVTVGGAGKTPAAIAVAALLGESGRRPAFLTRGHGGRLRGPVQVDRTLHAFPAVGDEALLLSRHAPTVVSRNRPAGAALAAEAGADVIVMDDGLQNPTLAKTRRIAVFDAGVGIGNGRVCPAGPLRAPLGAQWPLVDAVLIVGDGPPGETVARDAVARDRPVLHADLVPDPAAAGALAGRRVLAFAGIGRPEKFFATLRELGADIVLARAFADHHAYRPGEIAALLREAGAAGLLPVTTEKDLVRLAVLPVEGLHGITALPVRLRFRDAEAARALLAGAI